MSSNNTTVKIEQLSASLMHPEYKEAMHLVVDDFIKLFRADQRMLRASLYRGIFKEGNKPVRVRWHNPENSIKKITLNKNQEVESIEYISFSDYQDLIEANGSPDIDTDTVKYEFRFHMLNAYGLAYLTALENLLLQFGDDGVANLGSLLAQIPEAIIGATSNLKSMKIIQESSKGADGTSIILEGHELLDISRSAIDPFELSWKEMELMLDDYGHRMEFNTPGRPTLSPVVELQFKTHNGIGIYEVLFSNEVYKVYKKYMADILDEAKQAAFQLRKELIYEWSKTLSSVTQYREYISNDIVTLTKILMEYDDVFSKFKIKALDVAEMFKEGGLFYSIKVSIKNIGVQLDKIDLTITDRLEQLNKTTASAKASIMNWGRWKNEMEATLGVNKVQGNFEELVNRYITKDQKKRRIKAAKASDIPKTVDASNDSPSAFDDEYDMYDAPKESLLNRILHWFHVR